MMPKTKSTAQQVDAAFKRIQEAWRLGVCALEPSEVPPLDELSKREDIKLTKRRRDLFTKLPNDLRLVRRYVPAALDTLEVPKADPSPARGAR